MTLDSVNSILLLAQRPAGSREITIIGLWGVYKKLYMAKSSTFNHRRKLIFNVLKKGSLS